MIGYTVYVAVGLEIMGHLPHHTYDAAFLRLDTLFGFNPLTFADRVARYPAASEFLLAVYCALPFVIAFVWLIEQDLQMRRAVLIGGCFCFVFYALFPAVGPWHFDWTRQVPMNHAPDNCMPSMHLTWALLLAVNARGTRLRTLLWAYAAAIGIATVALGEHYLVDLLAAVPYTFAVQWMAARLIDNVWLQNLTGNAQVPLTANSSARKTA
jgi:membrane-associated phospholipid phosphatase